MVHFILFLMVGTVQAAIAAIAATGVLAHPIGAAADLTRTTEDCGLRLTLAAFYWAAAVQHLLKPTHLQSAAEAQLSALLHLSSAMLGLAIAASTLVTCTGTTMAHELFLYKPSLAIFLALSVHGGVEVRHAFRRRVPGESDAAAALRTAQACARSARRVRK